jgi:hypothetical protein
MTDFNFLTTHVGSAPHTEALALNKHLVDVLDIPAWLQLPRRSFRENIYTQFAPTLPGLQVDEEREKAIIHIGPDFDEGLAAFYELIIADDVEAFGLKEDYAQGFFLFKDALAQKSTQLSSPTAWCKGQVMGPISFGLTITDQTLRACLYHEAMPDVLVKNAVMNSRWQIQQLKPLAQNMIMFVDEPYMASFGSAYVNLSREQAIGWMDEVYDAIHAEGALAGTHCCGNTDWAVLLGTKVDILNLDALNFIENLALYPVELRNFLNRGGSVCWGLIPNDERIYHETALSLADRLRAGIKLICEKAAARGVTIHPEEFSTRSLVAPACGLGSTNIPTAEKVYEVLQETGQILQNS